MRMPEKGTFTPKTHATDPVSTVNRRGRGGEWERARILFADDVMRNDEVGVSNFTDF